MKPPSLLNKLALSLGLIVASTGYAAWQHANGSTIPALAASSPTPEPSVPPAAAPALIVKNDELEQALAQDDQPVTATIADTTPPPPPAATAAPAPAATPAPTSAVTSAPTSNTSSGMGMSGMGMGGGMMGQYKDGSYTGSAANAYYGTVQVQAVVSGGKIADVQFLQSPSGRGNSVRINAYAMPILSQEAVQAQSAQVNGVSGATFTSQAFVQSLASALAQANA